MSTLRRFEGCLEVEGWLKTGNKGHLFQAWLSRKALPTFLPVLLIRDKAECHLIKDVTMRKLLISPAKMIQLSLSIVQHLARWPQFFISLLQSACLREHLYKIWEKSIWYFYHARATLSRSEKTSTNVTFAFPWHCVFLLVSFLALASKEDMMQSVGGDNRTIHLEGRCVLNIVLVRQLQAIPYLLREASSDHPLGRHDCDNHL